MLKKMNIRILKKAMPPKRLKKISSLGRWKILSALTKASKNNNKKELAHYNSMRELCSKVYRQGDLELYFASFRDGNFDAYEMLDKRCDSIWIGCTKTYRECDKAKQLLENLSNKKKEVHEAVYADLVAAHLPKVITEIVTGY